MNSIDPAMDLSSLPIIPILMIAAVFCLATIVVYGYAMKWSLSLAGCGQHGFGWSFCVSFAAGMSSGLVSIVLAFFADSVPPFLPIILAMVAAVLTVSVMTQSGPIASGVAYMAFMFIGGMGMMLTVAVLAVASFAFIEMGEFAKMAQAMEPDMNADVESTAAEEDMWAALPRQLDNAFFESEESVSEVSASDEHRISGDFSMDQPHGESQAADPVREDDAQTPRPNSVQVNPFVE
ncbi:hypothetical protein [Rhodopirellula sp. P2]|uniref:hypothetical protein n=1 Tax=Rhodopirellula sp. P2 TaxID=2127060 RepID=UPI002367A6EF|nr:hypothetical protein [Rhodopirellula sp. P2]WDQ19157.1 hypothetical protein PSR62_11615 [Rhodopirellula sp. P2]